jgi:hypothetical protein
MAVVGGMGVAIREGTVVPVAGRIMWFSESRALHLSLAGFWD